MSARSSSGSWSGAGRSPPDIIDLDKFMRGAVRPVRDGHSLRCGNNLVVDAGGVDRTPGAAAVASSPAHIAPLPAPPAPTLTAPSDSSGSRPRPHGKRFSHDSGLSDTSYARRKHRPHRRAVGDISGLRAPRSAAGGAGGARGTDGAGSSSSLRAFRAVCERALLDQQAQLARVAQLCERLSERAPAPAPAPAPRSPLPRRSERSATDSSDVSSSSRSTRDQRRKDKHRTDECKTYKIIMNKLDELNRLFAARARSPPPAGAARAARPAPAPAPASSGSVSVSDKLVSTEPEPPRGLTRDLQVLHNVVTIRGGSAYGACGGGRARHAGRALARSRALSVALDVAPSDALPHIATESVEACESRAATGTSGGDPRCGFDLDDPVHIQLYSQAKRLQAMSATTRRARSVDPTARRYERSGRYEQEKRRSPSVAPRAREAAREQPREQSLCSLCRGYWRTVTHYIAAQFFCCPDNAANAVVGAFACCGKKSCRPPRCPGGCKPRYW